MKRLMLALLSVACTHAALAGDSDPERPAILAQIDRFFQAMAAQDVKTYADLQLADGMTYSQRFQADGGVLLRHRPIKQLIEELPNTPGLSERIWDPVVMRRGPMAAVWAPYEFKIDGKVSHCGIDAFNLVKVDGVWKIANAMWTVEPNACRELGATNTTLPETR